MSESAALIPVDDEVVLEAMVGEGAGVAAALLCHPHPLYGGTMDNNVVLAARDALAALEIGTVRFNFRGVGASTGAFADGEGEADDVAAVHRFLDGRVRRRYVVAYSFGVFAALKAVARGLRPDAVALIAPPVTFMPFAGLSLADAPTLIVSGDRDDFCSLSDLESWLKTCASDAPDLSVLENTDHFFWGREAELRRRLTQLFAKVEVSAGAGPGGGEGEGAG